VGVPPIPTLFLLYIGYKLGGVFGMIAAVPLGLIIITMYQEGAFSTTKDSVLILITGINRFRKLDKFDMVAVEEMRIQEKKLAKEFADMKEPEQREKKEKKNAEH